MEVDSKKQNINYRSKDNIIYFLNEHWNLLTFLTWKLKNVDFLSEVYVKFHFMWKDLAKTKPKWQIATQQVSDH